ncbi:hypothetical protein D3C80_1895590 [compost metagenome]
MAAEQELLEHVDLQHAEAAAEGDLLFGGNALVAKHQHVVIEMGPVDPGEVFAADRSGQVQADDLGADGTTERQDFEGLLLCAVDGRQGVRGR